MYDNMYKNVIEEMENAIRKIVDGRATVVDILMWYNYHSTTCLIPEEDIEHVMNWDGTARKVVNGFLHGSVDLDSLQHTLSGLEDIDRIYAEYVK